MFSLSRISLALGLLFLGFSLFLYAQNKRTQSASPPLEKAKTMADVMNYVQSMMQKHDPNAHSDKENAVYFSNTFLPAGEKLLAIAKTPTEKSQGYALKLSAYRYQKLNGIDGAEAKIDALLDEMSKIPDVQELLAAYRFQQFSDNAVAAEPTAENFARFKKELKTWIGKTDSISQIADLGLEVAERNKVSSGDCIKELLDYINSPECTVLSAEEKKQAGLLLEKKCLLSMGSDPKLYGKTLDNKDFDWQTLRGKYVLIKFTATWCGPCQMEVPGMLYAYDKYRDKGLEIVSVYVFQREDDPVAAVKEFVAKERLPWIILSESLTEKAGMPQQWELYGIEEVPTMVLTDKEGKVILTDARGEALQAKLAEIFK